MKPNSKTQSDAGLKFDGAEVMTQNRSNKFRGNQWSGHSNDGRTVQMAQAPNRKGNMGCGIEGPKTPPSHTPDTHAKGAYGMPQVRNPGGTRKWEPSATGNYKGNPDKINAGAGPRKGNSQ